LGVHRPAGRAHVERGLLLLGQGRAASLQPKKPPLPEPVYAVGSTEYQAQQAAKGQAKND
jgi:hypothetical protein